jgi:PilZ domain
MTSDESPDSSVPNPAEKRRYRRCKVPVQVELHLEGVGAPLRTATSETSLGGCYVETMFTFAVGTLLTMTLWFGDEKVTTECRVATCFPQVGNGIEFIGMSADARTKLDRFLAEHESE